MGLPGVRFYLGVILGDGIDARGDVFKGYHSTLARSAKGKPGIICCQTAVRIQILPVVGDGEGELPVGQLLCGQAKDLLLDLQRTGFIHLRVGDGEGLLAVSERDGIAGLVARHGTLDGEVVVLGGQVLVIALQVLVLIVPVISSVQLHAGIHELGVLLAHQLAELALVLRQRIGGAVEVEGDGIEVRMRVVIRPYLLYLDLHQLVQLIGEAHGAVGVLHRTVPVHGQTDQPGRALAGRVGLDLLIVAVLDRFTALGGDVHGGGGEVLRHDRLAVHGLGVVAVRILRPDLRDGPDDLLVIFVEAGQAGHGGLPFIRVVQQDAAVVNICAIGSGQSKPLPILVQRELDRLIRLFLRQLAPILGDGQLHVLRVRDIGIRELGSDVAILILIIRHRDLCRYGLLALVDNLNARITRDGGRQREGGHIGGIRQLGHLEVGDSLALSAQRLQFRIVPGQAIAIVGRATFSRSRRILLEFGIGGIARKDHLIRLTSHIRRLIAVDPELYAALEGIGHIHAAKFLAQDQRAAGGIVGDLQHAAVAVDIAGEVVHIADDEAPVDVLDVIALGPPDLLEVVLPAGLQRHAVPLHVEEDRGFAVLVGRDVIFVADVVAVRGGKLGLRQVIFFTRGSRPPQSGAVLIIVCVIRDRYALARVVEHEKLEHDVLDAAAHGVVGVLEELELVAADGAAVLGGQLHLLLDGIVEAQHLGGVGHDKAGAQLAHRPRLVFDDVRFAVVQPEDALVAVVGPEDVFGDVYFLVFFVLRIIHLVDLHGQVIHRQVFVAVGQAIVVAAVQRRAHGVDDDGILPFAVVLLHGGLVDGLEVHRHVDGTIRQRFDTLDLRRIAEGRIPGLTFTCHLFLRQALRSLQRSVGHVIGQAVHQAVRSAEFFLRDGDGDLLFGLSLHRDVLLLPRRFDGLLRLALLGSGDVLI